MTATILDGKRLASLMEAEMAEQVQALKAQGVPPTLAAVLIGEDPASQVYVRNKEKACQRVGITSRMERHPSSFTEEQLLNLVEQLNADPLVHGILVQLPLPRHIHPQRILDAVHPLKDVDGFHPENVGLVSQGRPRFISCTPWGVQQLLIRNGLETAGKHAVVVGRSDIVGKPMASLLMQRGAGGDATVTVCHSRTPNLADITRQADLLIVAVGHPATVNGSMIRPGAIVIDVGMNRTPGGLVGDVDYASALPVASHITPVPGGVGPLTVAMLLQNTLKAATLNQ